MQPVRIQRSRQHKQVSPNGLPIVYVGRPGKWGNPFSIKDFTPELAMENYRHFIQTAMITHSVELEELRGKNLSCWCKPGSPCHADVLLELANK